MAHLIPYAEVVNKEWRIWQNDDNKFEAGQIQLILLLDIRTELRRFNKLLQCDNFRSIPAPLRTIARQTQRKPPHGKKATRRR